MNELTIFNYEDKRIRTQVINDEPWFVGKDVAEILGYDQPRKAIERHVDNDDGMKHTIIDNLGRNQEVWMINESGLYSLILSSKLEGAKKFKRWVTSEVLPSIRKHGMYATNEKLKDMETKINELQNSSPISKLIKEIQQANINLSCAEVQSSVRESLNSVTTTTTVRLYPERKRKVINIFEL